jgi:acyl-coenzyme A synthetase/AMP-(fatty) acid ligase
MKNNKPLLDEYDLSSVREIYSGAAPLGPETASQIQEQYPNWIIRGIYGTLYPTNF